MTVVHAGDSLPVHHLYVHVPFCARRCAYCDFSIAVRREVPWRAFADAVVAEGRMRDVSLTEPLHTVYLGGGTPSQLSPDGVAALLDGLRTLAPWATSAEVTLEANPEDVTPAAVTAWMAAGVTRLSLGVQSFQDPVLRWMHRVHDAETAPRAVRSAQDAGLTSISLDLIFAVPDAVPRDWGYDLEAALACEPEHLSLYGLTIEPQTPLARWTDRGAVREAPEERYAREFLLAHDRMTAAGFRHYEVSNFARPGRESRHNRSYWRGVPYLGLGPSAHGFDGAIRRWNVAPYAAWQRAVVAGIDPVEGREALTGANRLAEAVYLGLRTSAGLDLSVEEIARVQPWVEAGWGTLIRDGAHTRFTCTADGWLRLDALAADLTAFRDDS